MHPDDLQLAFHVAPHPRLAELPGGGYLGSTLKLAGEVYLENGRVLQAGDRLTVTVAGADGEIVAGVEATVETVGFATVRDRGSIIGTERQHKAKLA